MCGHYNGVMVKRAVFQVRCEPGELEAWRLAAGDVPLSRWLRRVANEAAAGLAVNAGGIYSASPPVPLESVLTAEDYAVMAEDEAADGSGLRADSGQNVVGGGMRRLDDAPAAPVPVSRPFVPDFKTGGKKR